MKYTNKFEDFPQWYRPLIVVAALFALASFPVSLLAISSGAALIGVGVFVSGLVLLFVVILAWLLEPLPSVMEAQSDG